MRTQFGVLYLLTLWVVYSDAWFWARTGTTTFPPTVDHEGSGSPAFSGEPPSENIAGLGAEIIGEGQGIQKLVQARDETTDGPRPTTLMPTTLPETQLDSETGTAVISSHIRQPGNGTSSLMGMGSGGSDQLGFAEGISGHGPGLELELAPATSPGLWSGSGFSSESGSATGSQDNWRTSFDENNQEIVMPTDLRGLDSGGSEVPQTNETQLQNSVLVIDHSTDELHNLDRTKSNQNLDFSVETNNYTKVNEKLNSSTSWNDSILTKYSHEISTPRYLRTPIVGNDSLETTELPNDNQPVDVGKLPAGELTANQPPLANKETIPDSFASQTLSTNQIPTNTSKIFITQPQTNSTKPDSTSIPIAAQFQEASPASTTSQIHQNIDATQSSATKRELSQEATIAPTGGRAPAESHTEVAKSALILKSPQCLVLDTALPFCSSMVGESFVLPNYLNQSSVEEVRMLLNEWAWLLKSPCHHSLEWFFCLLLVPKCSSLVPLPVLPCRSFCEVLRDSCWALLDEGRLPVECHTLPDEEDDGYQCLSVSNQKGNCWFK